MKYDESFPEIGNMLRTHKTEAFTPPGLETRILHALEQRKPTTRKSWWPWFVLPPAIAAITFVASHMAIGDKENAPPVSNQPPTAAPDEPAVSLVDADNPLNDESIALGRDMQRAGDFLMDCMPSITRPGE